MHFRERESERWKWRFSFSLRVDCNAKRRAAEAHEGETLMRCPWKHTHTHSRTLGPGWSCQRSRVCSALKDVQHSNVMTFFALFILIFFAIFSILFHLPFSPFVFFRSYSRFAFVLFSFFFFFWFSNVVSFGFLWQTKTSLNRLCTRCDALARLRSNSDNSVSWKSYALARALSPIPHSLSLSRPMLQPPALLSLCSTSHSPTHTHSRTPTPTPRYSMKIFVVAWCPVPRTHTGTDTVASTVIYVRLWLCSLSLKISCLFAHTQTHTHTSIYTHVHTYVCVYKCLFIYI